MTYHKFILELSVQVFRHSLLKIFYSHICIYCCQFFGCVREAIGNTTCNGTSIYNPTVANFKSFKHLYQVMRHMFVLNLFFFVEYQVENGRPEILRINFFWYNIIFVHNQIVIDKQLCSIYNMTTFSACFNGISLEKRFVFRFYPVFKRHFFGVMVICTT
jgi:hypothetical protein